jgi:hypothetical protein
MNVKIKLINEQFCDNDCTEYSFTNADTLSNGSHLVVRDERNMQLIFKCRLDNIDCFEKWEKSEGDESR